MNSLKSRLNDHHCNVLSQSINRYDSRRKVRGFSVHGDVGHGRRTTSTKTAGRKATTIQHQAQRIQRHLHRIFIRSLRNRDSINFRHRLVIDRLAFESGEHNVEGELREHQKQPEEYAGYTE